MVTKLLQHLLAPLLPPFLRRVPRPLYSYQQFGRNCKACTIGFLSGSGWSFRVIPNKHVNIMNGEPCKASNNLLVNLMVKIANHYQKLHPLCMLSWRPRWPNCYPGLLHLNLNLPLSYRPRGV